MFIAFVILIVNYVKHVSADTLKLVNMNIFYWQSLYKINLFNLI